MVIHRAQLSQVRPKNRSSPGLENLLQLTISIVFNGIIVVIVVLFDVYVHQFPTHQRLPTMSDNDRPSPGASQLITRSIRQSLKSPKIV